MKYLKTYIFLTFIFVNCFSQDLKTKQTSMELKDKLIKLPSPRLDGPISVEKALKTRRSVREFSNKQLQIAEIAQLLWSAQGITSSDGRRTAPSAGALYPLEIYLVAGNVNELAAGIYKYDPIKHALLLIAQKDVRAELSAASLYQESIQKASASIVFTAVYDRIKWKYGERGARYVYIEVGHASQNVFLQSTALGIKTVVIGAFHDTQLKKILQLVKDEEPLYIMPIGK